MSRINTCLKVLFAFFNTLFAIAGGVILVLAITLTVTVSKNGVHEVPGLTIIMIILYISGVVTLTISLLGACGACMESRGALITFLVCMVIVAGASLKSGVSYALNKPFQDQVLEQSFRAMLPLDRADSSVQEMAIEMQNTFQCCGIFGPSDWENNVPQSCFCDADVTPGKCTNIPGMSVYKEPCFPKLMGAIGTVPRIILGVNFGLALLAILGMMLSLVMIHQLNTAPSRPTMVLSVPTVFSTQPPKYEELHNLPPPY